MSNEFDDAIDLPPAVSPPAPARRPACRTTPPASRIAVRLYTSASVPLRARLLACLMGPLGPLGVAGVAAGAFAGFVHRRGTADVNIDLERAARVSGEQVLELARFADQVNPQALQHFAGLISGDPLALTTFSASALVLLYRALQASMSANAPRWNGDA